jgi:dTMP kinase
MFISFEGCEGTGKTTLANYLFHKLNKKKYPVTLTKEPGGYTKNSNKFIFLIKKILFNFYNKIDSHTEALLYAANRVEHLKNIILPSLEKQKIVICDRFIDSSFAYQGYSKKLGFDFIKQINYFALKYLPNLTFYLDLDPIIGLNRLNKYRKHKIEYFDLQNIGFHQKVREGYLKLCKIFPNRIFKINANENLDKIKKKIKLKIMNTLKIKL